MGISIDNVWAKAQRLSPSERLALSRRLEESVTETETARRERVTKEMDQFFGGWADDERTTDEIMAQIRAGRTTNTYPKFYVMAELKYLLDTSTCIELLRGNEHVRQLCVEHNQLCCISRPSLPSNCSAEPTMLPFATASRNWQRRGC